MRAMRTFVRRLVGYGFAALLLLQIASCTPDFANLVSGLGVRTAETTPEHPMWRRMGPYGPEEGDPGLWAQAALARFPTLNSCLFSWSNPPLWADRPSRDDLWNFRWRNLRTPPEMRVCLWRVASYLGDATEVSRWFRGQGFKSSPRTHTNSAGRTVTIVDAHWNLKASAPRTLCHGPLFCMLPEIAYSMLATSYWSADGKTLLAIEIGYNAL